jgi:hypothetical protein
VLNVVFAENKKMYAVVPKKQFGLGRIKVAVHVQKFRRKLVLFILEQLFAAIAQELRLFVVFERRGHDMLQVLPQATTDVLIIAVVCNELVQQGMQMFARRHLHELVYLDLFFLNAFQPELIKTAKSFYTFEHFKCRLFYNYYLKL